MICDICRKRENTLVFNLYAVDIITNKRVINRTLYVCDECMAEIIGSIHHLIVHNDWRNSASENNNTKVPKQYRTRYVTPSIPWIIRQKMKKINSNDRINFHFLLNKGSYSMDILKNLREWK